MKKKIKIFLSADGYDLASSVYDRRVDYLNSFEKGGLWPLLGDLKNKKVLDVGAGTGRLAIELSRRGAEVTALDVSPKMLEVLHHKNRRIKTIVASAEAMPFADESFDWVVAAFLIVHLDDPRCFFDEAYRVLKPGGRLLVTNINQKEPPEVKTKSEPIKIISYYHRPEKIRDLLAELAFGVEEKIIEENGRWVCQILVGVK